MHALSASLSLSPLSLLSLSLSLSLCTRSLRDECMHCVCTGRELRRASAARIAGPAAHRLPPTLHQDASPADRRAGRASLTARCHAILPTACSTSSAFPSRDPDVGTAAARRPPPPHRRHGTREQHTGT